MDYMKNNIIDYVMLKQIMMMNCNVIELYLLEMKMVDQHFLHHYMFLLMLHLFVIEDQDL